MGKKISKTMIGAFVIGAVVLLVATVLILGSGKFFQPVHHYVTFFEGSVKGLNPGSPVMFRGVKVGSVSDISIMVDPRVRQLKIPVVFSLEPEKIKGIRAELVRDPKMIKNAIGLGLRAQLQTLSFVTGQLMVALDFFPEKPAVYVGLVKDYPEIPSVPTPLAELQRTVEQLPLREMVEDLRVTIRGIERLVTSINARKTAENIEGAIGDVRTLARNTNEKLGPLVDGLNRASGSAESALNETKETVVALRGDVKELVKSTNTALEAAQSALKQSESTLQTYSGDSRLIVELNRTLRELSATSRSFRRLSDYLERHPEALLRGKAAGQGE